MYSDTSYIATVENNLMKVREELADVRCFCVYDEATTEVIEGAMILLHQAYEALRSIK